MANFGDLPRGEIPEPLKYNRPMCKACFSLSFFPLNLYVIYYNLLPLESTILANGIRVVTEKSSTSQTAK